MDADPRREIIFESDSDHDPNSASSTPVTPAPSTQTSGETFRIKMSDGKLYGPITLNEIEQWAREGRVPKDALLFPTGGGDPESVFAVPRLAAILSAPPTAPGVMHTAASKSSPSSLIPTGNPLALWGYYISVAGLIPMLFIVCPISLILGALGVVRAIRVPESKGLLHALVAIILSIASPLGWWYFYTRFDIFQGVF